MPAPQAEAAKRLDNVLRGGHGRAPLVFFTVDMHDDDRGDDIMHFCEFAASNDVPVSFFIPAAALGSAEFAVLRRYRDQARFGFESHTLHHNEEERRALRSGSGARLGFLAEAKRRHEDFFGSPPVAFRAPFWTGLSAAVIEELQALGYCIDCSAVPQRLSVLSSHPWENPYLFAPRSIHAIGERLVEVPTSCVGIPFATQLFRAAPDWLPAAAIRGIAIEARLRRTVAVNAMFHVDDFCDTPARHRRPFTWRDLMLRSEGGLGFREFLLLTDRKRIVERMRKVIETFKSWRAMTLRGFAAQVFEGT